VKRYGAVLVLTTIMAVLCMCGCAAENGNAETGFYAVSGRQILDPQGEPVILKGIHFNNGVYQKPDSADDFTITVDHTAESYLEAAEMGLDHVRLAINYQLFEDDSDPYVYKEDGFGVIDRNLEWAKAAGIDLILQMKWPQGGYQMETDQMAPVEWGVGNGGKCLWMDIDENGVPLDSENYKENQARLVALWTEIAERYANEPAIIGYNLFNEPVLLQKESVQATVAQVRDLMQRIADGIRTVDKNHILFVERPVGCFTADGTAAQMLSVAESQFLIDDDNVVYEFHFYEPFSFTHQGSDWLPQFPAGEVYPSAELKSFTVEDWTPVQSFSSASGEREEDWVYFESEPFTAGTNADGQPYNLAHVQAAALGLSAGESVWFDDLAVTRTDTEGRTVTLFAYDFSDGLGQFQWGGSYDMNGTASFGFDPAVGRTGAGSLCISESAGGNYADIGSGDWLYLQEGYTYRVSGWVKGSGSIGGAAVYAEDVLLNDKTYVEARLQEFLAFGTENEVPMHMGEWGTHYTAWDYGYEAYIKDLCALLEKYGLSSSYYSYRDSAFGVYVCDDLEELGGRNDELFDLLTEWYGSPAPSFGEADLIGGKVTAAIRNSAAGTVYAAMYDGRGRLVEQVSRPLTGAETSVELKFERTDVPEDGQVRLYYVDSGWRPLCPEKTL